MKLLPPRTPWLLALARRYARRRLARGLDGAWIAGLEPARRAARERPLLLVANHVGWWDSFLMVAVDQALSTEGYALMDADNLRGLTFFARLGALPLERRSGPAARAGLRRAAALLDRPGRALWVFPQGEHRPAHLRPLRFQAGTRLLARLCPDAAAVPIAIQYAWGTAPLPAAWVHLGAVIPAERIAAEGSTACLEAAVRAGLEEIDRALAGADHAFRPLVRSRRAPPQRGLGARLLGARSRDV